MMKTENLRSIVTLLYKIDEKLLDMHSFACDLGKKKPEQLLVCNTPACVLGHAIQLDSKRFTEIWDDLKKRFKDNSLCWISSKAFINWSEEYTGFSPDTVEWQWCFGSDWFRKDNTVKGAIYRINLLIRGEYRTSNEYTIYKETNKRLRTVIS